MCTISPTHLPSSRQICVTNIIPPTHQANLTWYWTPKNHFPSKKLPFTLNKLTFSPLWISIPKYVNVRTFVERFHFSISSHFDFWKELIRFWFHFSEKRNFHFSLEPEIEPDFDFISHLSEKVKHLVFSSSLLEILKSTLAGHCCQTGKKMLKL